MVLLIQQIYFVLIINGEKKLAKITAKSKKKTIVKDRSFRLQAWVCQNVSNEVFGMVQISGENSKSFWVCVQGELQKYTRPSSPLSKDEASEI